MKFTQHIFAASIVVALASHALAQCPGWSRGFADGTVSGTVRALALYDEGAGSVMFAGGEFTVAGGINAARIARWDGAQWSNVGAGANVTIDALTVFDDGSGAALYAAGEFTSIGGVPAGRVGRWNGSAWSAVGTGMNAAVRALAVFDDGTGPALYAGGEFTLADGASASHVARWNGSTWTPLAQGTSGNVLSLAVYDSGSGASLYAGGSFLSAGVSPARNIARWNGTTWSILGNGTNGTVRALAVHDDGNGAALYVGGDFSTADSQSANHAARWNGNAWSALGNGTNSAIRTLYSYDDGRGSALYAGGAFAAAGNVAAAGIAKWNGLDWSALGDGIAGQVEELIAYDDGTGRKLIAAGNCTVASNGGVVNVLDWDGVRWSALSEGVLPNYGSGLCTFDSGNGPELYISGLIGQAGAVHTGGMAKFDGEHWSTVGGVQNDVWALAFVTFDDGSGPALYAGGLFSSVGGVSGTMGLARWNGSAWSSVGGGTDGGVYSMCVFDDGTGPALYVGGLFTHVGAGVSARCIARWDGSTWSALGSGMTPPPSFQYATVSALRAFDDGSGPALYAGGSFATAGGVTVRNTARWNGASWSAVGQGLYATYPSFDRVRAFEVFDDGTGRHLYAGGIFRESGPAAMNGLARWDGTNWIAVTNDAPFEIYSLATFDDGTGGGSQLYAGFATRIARLQGSTLATYALVDNLSYGQATSMLPIPATSSAPAELWVAGNFSAVGGVPSKDVARLRACSEVGTTYCFGDGLGAACPCGNTSSVGARAGCLNSFGTGAALRASGLASVSNDSLVLAASGMSQANHIPTFFQGTLATNGGAGSAFGDGLRCASGSTLRIGATPAVLGACTFGAGFPGGALISVRGAIPAAGATRTYQAFYRNAANFCTPSTFNLTNGVSVSWAP